MGWLTGLKNDPNSRVSIAGNVSRASTVTFLVQRYMPCPPPDTHTYPGNHLSVSIIAKWLINNSISIEGGNTHSTLPS